MQRDTSKVVFTNGCFDIIHRGHLELLRYCSGIGRVIVGINSDVSVRRLKGHQRPINSQEDRAFHLRSIKYVDEVFVFCEDTPYDLIKKIMPDVIVKGGDYKKEEVVGHDLAEILIYEYIHGYSTTETIENITSR